MRSVKIKLVALLLSGIGLAKAQAQDAFTASGGDAFGNSGTVAYTVAETFYCTYSGTQGSEAQGVQQPYEISLLGIDNAIYINPECSVYPNPVPDYILLKIGDLLNLKLSYLLNDASGNTLISDRISSRETTIKIERLAPAVYFLIITDSAGFIKTFKIVKN